MASLSTASSTRSTSSASLIDDRRGAVRERSLRLHDMHACSPACSTDDRTMSNRMSLSYSRPPARWMC